MPRPENACTSIVRSEPAAPPRAASTLIPTPSCAPAAPSADCKADPTWLEVSARLDGNAAYAGATNDSQPFDPSVKEYLSFSAVDLAQLVYDPDLPMWGKGGASNKTCRWWFWSSL